jgi:hypothetical protein
MGRLETVPRGGRSVFFVDDASESAFGRFTRAGVDVPKKGDLDPPVAFSARSAASFRGSELEQTVALGKSGEAKPKSSPETASDAALPEMLGISWSGGEKFGEGPCAWDRTALYMVLLLSLFCVLIVS